MCIVKICHKVSFRHSILTQSHSCHGIGFVRYFEHQKRLNLHEVVLMASSTMPNGHGLHDFLTTIENYKSNVMTTIPYKSNVMTRMRLN